LLRRGVRDVDGHTFDDVVLATEALGRTKKYFIP
jgi:hypothetical protein